MHADETAADEADRKRRLVAKIATGEIEEDIDDDGKSKAAVELGRKGDRARARALSPEKRSAIAKKAAKRRWAKLD